MNTQTLIRVGILFCIVGSASLSGADGINTPVVSVPLTSERGIAQNAKLKAAVDAGNQQCFVQAESAGFAMGSAATSAAETAAGSLDTAGAAGNAAQMSTKANANAQYLCESAMKTCGTATVEVKGALEGFKVSELNLASLCESRSPPDIACAIKHKKQAASVEKDIAVVSELQANCKSTYGYRFASAGGSMVSSVADAQKISKTVEALSTTGADQQGMSTGMKVGLGVLGGAVLMNVFGDKGGGGGDNGASDLAKAAAADPQCQSARANEFDHCQKYMREVLCNNPATMGDSRCEKWSNNYCGFGTAKTDANGSPVAAPGLGSQVCQDSLAQRYCQKAERVGCYSCLNLRDRAQPTCQRQPAACATTNTDAEMGQFRAKCPDDPIFSNPRWASIQPSTGGTTTPPGQPPTNGSANKVVGASAKTTSTTSIIGDVGARTTASTGYSANANPDVGGAYGQSVLSQSSNAYKSLCDQGQLNNCGTRANLN